MCTFLYSLQTVLPQRCLTGVVPLLMKAFRGQWSESCRDPSGTLFIHLWIFCSSVVSLHLQAWTSVVLMRSAQNSPVLTITSGQSPHTIQVELLDVVLQRQQLPYSLCSACLTLVGKQVELHCSLFIIDLTGQYDPWWTSCCDASLVMLLQFTSFNTVHLLSSTNWIELNYL